MSYFSSSLSNDTSQNQQQQQYLPDSTTDPQQLSYSQLRDKLISQYAKNGLIKQLKTQLRSRILLDLKGKARDIQRDNYLRGSFEAEGSENLNPGESYLPNQQHDKENVTPASSNSTSSLKQQLYYSIILSFLKQHNLNYTISVLLSEADISDALLHSNAVKMMGELLHREDLPALLVERQQLRVDSRSSSSSRTHRRRSSSANRNNANVSPHKLNALEMLFQLADLFLSHTHKSTQSTQTDAADASQKHSLNAIDHKLRMLDEHYLKQNASSAATSTAQSLEERMLDFQRKCELRTRQEVEEKMKFFEETSLSTMRLEESAKYREKLATLKEKYEEDYSQKVKRLHEREQEMRQLLEKKQKDVDSSSHEHRQNMMKEVTKLQNKQNALRRLELEIERSRQEVADKERQLEVQHKQKSIDMDTELKVLKQQLESKYEQQQQELEVQRQMFQKEKIQMESEKQAMDNAFRAHGDVVMLRETSEQQRLTIESLKTQLSELRTENKHLKTVCDELRHENNQFKYAKGDPQSSNDIPANVHTSLNQRYNNLLRENQDLEQVNKVHTNKIQDLLKRNEILEKENTQISHTLDLERQSKSSKFEEQARQMQEESLRERAQLRQLSYKWNAERSTLQSNVEKLEERNEELQRQVEEERLETRKVQLALSNETALLKQTQQALENALSGDSSSELQAQGEKKDRLIRELQRELEHVKSEKKKLVQDLTSKIDEEARHAANLKEALAQNQKMLEKSQSSYSDVATSQEERDKHHQVEMQMLEDKYESKLTQITNEKKRLELLVEQKQDEIEQLQKQISQEREQTQQVESKRRALEDDLTTLNRQLKDRENDERSHERIEKEYEQRIQDVKRDSEHRLRGLQHDIELSFSSRIRSVNPEHAEALRESISASSQEMLRLLGSSEQLEERIHSEERLLGIPSKKKSAPITTEPVRQQPPASVTPQQPTQVAQQDYTTMQPAQQKQPEPVSTTNTAPVPEQAQQQPSTSQNTNQHITSTTPEQALEEPAPVQAPSSIEETSPATTTPQETTQPNTEASSNQETTPQKPETPQDESKTDMQKYMDDFKKQRQEEREQKVETSPSDDFHMTGFDMDVDDLGFERSDDELEDILGGDDDEFF